MPFKLSLGIWYDIRIIIFWIVIWLCIFHFKFPGKTKKIPEKKIPTVDSVEQSQTKRTDREKAWGGYSTLGLFWSAGSSQPRAAAALATPNSQLMRIVDAIVVVETATHKCAIRVALLCSSTHSAAQWYIWGDLVRRIFFIIQLNFLYQPSLFSTSSIRYFPNVLVHCWALGYCQCRLLIDT